MATREDAVPFPQDFRTRIDLPLLVGAFAFAVLFWSPFTTLVRDWISDPDAGHGLLLGPVAVWLAWRSGLREYATPNRLVGVSIVAGAILLRYVSGLAAELFTMRISLLMAVVGLIAFSWGVKQVLRWWLPLALLFLSVPIPDVIMSTLALPLQLVASKWGAVLLEWRQVPVELAGNVIYLPGQALFVTEACSGLRSLTALIALGLLTGGILLRSGWSRALLLGLTLPVAMVLNSIRIFLTGFLVFFVSPDLGEGVMHYTEGWAIFVVALLILGMIAMTLARFEEISRRRTV